MTDRKPTTAWFCNDCIAIVDTDVKEERELADWPNHTAMERSDVRACEECDGTDLDRVELCEACLANGQRVRVHEDYGLCIAHAQAANRSEELNALITEIGLLPGKLRT